MARTSWPRPVIRIAFYADGSAPWARSCGRKASSRPKPGAGQGPGRSHLRRASPPAPSSKEKHVWITPAQVALAWVVAQGEHVIPIPGTKTPKYLADNAGAGDVELSPADLADLDALPAPEGGRY
ncbi:aldo/keto reductase [Streptomyces sp. NBC_00154]|nr:aldo/keto reductase [Streptomyces sp. NBC_00154]